MTGPELRKERADAEIPRTRLAERMRRSTVTVWRWENMAEVPNRATSLYRRALAELVAERAAADIEPGPEPVTGQVAA